MLEESLAIRREIGNKLGIAECLGGFASLAVQEKKEQVSARLWGASIAVRKSLGSFLPPNNQQRRQDSDFAAIEKALGQPTFTVALEEGRAMTLEEAMEYALGMTEEENRRADPA